MRKILTIVGARPQFIKASAVSHALAAAQFEEIIVHTGQHFDASMSDIFFDELDIPRPKINLAVHSLGHGAMTGRMLEGVEKTILAEKPDMVLVYGDTNSTLAGALAAAKLHVPVAHIEAGLRSFNRDMPEEINRVLVDHLSALLLCPTNAAVANLAKEGIRNNVHAVGDVMFDTTIIATQRAILRSKILDKLSLEPKTYAVATIHRAENTDDPVRFALVLNWLRDAARKQTIIMAVHPRTANLLRSQKMVLSGITMIEPLGYLDMTMLLHNSKAVFTDSGGLQKEAYFHRVPCVTLRDETEWVETVSAGWNRLWNVPTYEKRRDIPDYGVGNAASTITAVIAASLER
jgi:UDP-GlcNAc3NAcA epimerase